MKRQTRARRAAWAVLGAILFQALLPLVHHPATLAMAKANGFGNGSNFCFAPGSDPAAPGQSDKSPAHALPDCPICQTLHALAGYVPTPSPAVAILRGWDVFTPERIESPSIRRRDNEAARPRGPPALA